MKFRSLLIGTLVVTPIIALAQTGPAAKPLNDGWELRFVVKDTVPVCTMVKLSANGGVFGFSGGMDGSGHPIVKGIALQPSWNSPANRATTVSLSFGDGKPPVVVPGETEEHMVAFDAPLDDRLDAMDTATSIHIAFDALQGDFDIAGGKAASEEWMKCVINKGIR